MNTLIGTVVDVATLRDGVAVEIIRPRPAKDRIGLMLPRGTQIEFGDCVHPAAPNAITYAPSFPAPPGTFTTAVVISSRWDATVPNDPPHVSRFDGETDGKS